MAAYINFYRSCRLYLNIHRRSVLLGTKVFSSNSTTTTYSKAAVQFKSVNDMPGPPSIPVLGTAYRLLFTNKPIGKRNLELNLKDFCSYGSIVKLTFPNFSTIKIYDPSDAEAVFRSEPKYPKRFDLPLFNYYRETRKKPAGVFFLDGEEWYKHRNVINKRILRPKELEFYVPELNKIIDDLVNRLRNLRGSQGLENEIPDLENELFKWSFESVSHFLFDRRFHVKGDKPNPHAKSFIDSVRTFLEAVFPAFLVPIWFSKYIYETKSFKSFTESFDQMYKYTELFISMKIQELEEKGKLDSDKSNERVDFLTFLLSSKKLTREDLLSSVIDILFAGVDTTSNTMQWALYLMGKNTDKQQILYEEVRSVLPNGEQASMDTLSRMPYLRAWVKETLRLYPVLSELSRVLNEDLTLSGYNIPAGSQVNIMLYAMGRNESNFEDAHLFKPERWLRKNQNQNEIGRASCRERV